MHKLWTQLFMIIDLTMQLILRVMSMHSLTMFKLRWVLSRHRPVVIMVFPYTQWVYFPKGSMIHSLDTWLNNRLQTSVGYYHLNRIVIEHIQCYEHTVPYSTHTLYILYTYSTHTHILYTQLYIQYYDQLNTYSTMTHTVYSTIIFWYDDCCNNNCS